MTNKNYTIISGTIHAGTYTVRVDAINREYVADGSCIMDLCVTFPRVDGECTKAIIRRRLDPVIAACYDAVCYCGRRWSPLEPAYLTITADYCAGDVCHLSFVPDPPPVAIRNNSIGRRCLPPVSYDSVTVDDVASGTYDAAIINIAWDLLDNNAMYLTLLLTYGNGLDSQKGITQRVGKVYHLDPFTSACLGIMEVEADNRDQRGEITCKAVVTRISRDSRDVALELIDNPLTRSNNND